MKINSVLGPIKVDDLGSTLIHEHLGIGWPGWELDH
jgi:predicted metal-dependent phosphotriesterase family hydrolase